MFSAKIPGLSAVGGGELTMEQLAVIWELAAHRFEFNVYTFETLVGKMGVEVFKESFKLRRFNSEGAPQWPVSKYKNAFGCNRGTLVEYGMLRDSITYKLRKSRRGSGNISFTADPKTGFGWQRGDSWGKEEKDTVRSVYYAGVHNDGPSAVAVYQKRHNTRNKKKGVALEGSPRRIPQRQFMPSKWSSIKDSTVFEEKMLALEQSVMFNGIPATRIR